MSDTPKGTGFNGDESPILDEHDAEVEASLQEDLISAQKQEAAFQKGRTLGMNDALAQLEAALSDQSKIDPVFAQAVRGALKAGPSFAQNVAASPSFGQHTKHVSTGGVQSGRTSGANPNAQNFPKSAPRQAPEGLAKEPMIQMSLSVTTWRMLLLGVTVLKAFYGDQSLRFCASRLCGTQKPTELAPADVQELLALELDLLLRSNTGRTATAPLASVLHWCMDAIAQSDLLTPEQMALGVEPRTAKRDVQDAEQSGDGPVSPTLLTTPTHKQLFRLLSFIARKDHSDIQDLTRAEWTSVRQLAHHMLSALTQRAIDLNVVYELLYLEQAPNTVAEILEPNSALHSDDATKGFLSNFFAQSKAQSGEEETIDEIERRLRQDPPS